MKVPISESQPRHTPPCPDPSPNAQFGRIPYAIATSGAIANMKPGALRVYCLLCAHADADWVATVGMRRLAGLAGMLLSSVSRSVAELVENGLVSVEPHQNGRGFTYHIATTPSGNRSPGSEHPPFAGERTAEGADRSPAGAPTVRPLAQNRSPGSERNRRTEVEQQKPGAAAAAHSLEAGPPGDVLAKLARLGIGEPVRTELATMPGASVQAITVALKAGKVSDRAPAGVMVRELRARLPGAIEEAAMRAERRQQARAEAERGLLVCSPSPMPAPRPVLREPLAEPEVDRRRQIEEHEAFKRARAQGKRIAAEERARREAEGAAWWATLTPEQQAAEWAAIDVDADVRAALDGKPADHPMRRAIIINQRGPHALTGQESAA